MADLSIIEFIVYGFFAYTSTLMLILQVIKEPPSEKSGAIIRSIYLIVGIVSAFMIGLSGDDIIAWDVTNTIVAVNSTEVWTETISYDFPLSNPVWTVFHYFIGIIMGLYVFLQVITLLTKIR